MKKYFITGLILLLPAALTLSILSFLFNLLTEPFVGIVKEIFDHTGHRFGFLFFSDEHVQKFLSQLIILSLLFLLTVGLGFLANWFFFHSLVRFWEYILIRIPFVSNIYQTSKEVIHNLFTKSNSFKQVVMVPFPTSSGLTIGFITNDQVAITTKDQQPLIAVFVPTTPNPTSGFLMMCRSSDLVYLDMKVEDAFKYVISCGTISGSTEAPPSSKKDVGNQL